MEVPTTDYHGYTSHETREIDNNAFMLIYERQKGAECGGEETSPHDGAQVAEHLAATLAQPPAPEAYEPSEEDGEGATEAGIARSYSGPHPSMGAGPGGLEEEAEVNRMIRASSMDASVLAITAQGLG